ncbi:MAG: histidine kinase [Schwartzia sp.]|nr:histidine kinase [Schwartzia sp. (in: firmicutes)]
MENEKNDVSKDMNRKAQLFQNLVDKMPQDDVFLVETMEDDFHTTLFRSQLEIRDGLFRPMVVIIDDSIYTMIRVWAAGKAVNDANRAVLKEYLNQMNRHYKVFKYYDNEDGDIVVDACLAADERHFDPEMVATVIDVVMQHLQETSDNLEAAIRGEAPSAR